MNKYNEDQIEMNERNYTFNRLSIISAENLIKIRIGE